MQVKVGLLESLHFVRMLMTKAVQPLDTIDWMPDFELGVPEIDEEHRTLVALYNDLIHALIRGASRIMSQSIIRSLRRYMAEHMSREEAYIQRHGFPGADQHIREHREFSAAVCALPDKGMAESAAVLLREWILNHILISDRALFEHVKQNGCPTADRSPSPFAPR